MFSCLLSLNAEPAFDRCGYVAVLWLAVILLGWLAAQGVISLKEKKVS
jgi:hypothetical protein